jgi:YD repeat-containing protein
MSKTPQWSEEQLAYDGSSRRQSRRLTPRERDILTRILRDIVSELRRSGDLDSLWFIEGNGGIRMEPSEVPIIVDLLGVLTPRYE